MAETMRAAVLHAYGEPLRFEEVPRPVPMAGQVLVQVEACGLCHTDLHVCAGHSVPRQRKPPIILGHEGIGRVVVAGSGVEHMLGLRVGVPWLHDACGHCRECLGGAETFCVGQRALGFDVNGAFAEYVLADARFVAILDDAMDAYATAPLMCAGLTALGGVKKARLVPGAVCVIFGCGGLGLYAVQLAARTGAIVVAVDLDAAKLAAAQTAGADHAVLAGNAVEQVLDLVGPADACINFAPTTATWAAMTGVIRPRGRIISAALVSKPVPLDQEWLTATGVTLTGTSVGSRLEMAELLRLHARAPLAIDHRTIGLTQLNEALADLEAGRVTGRVVVDLRQDGGTSA